MCPALSECKFSQGIQITSLQPPQKKTTKTTTTNKLLSTRYSKRNVHFAFLQIGRARPTGCPKSRICVPSPAAGSRPPLPAWPRPCLCLKLAGGQLQRPEGAGGRAACGVRAEASARAFLWGSRPPLDWFGQCCRRSGRSQPESRLGVQSQPGAVADGAHFAAAGCAPGLQRRAELLGAAPPGLWAPAQPPRSLLPIHSLLSP